MGRAEQRGGGGDGVVGELQREGVQDRDGGGGAGVAPQVPYL